MGIGSLLHTTVNSLFPDHSPRFWMTRPLRTVSCAGILRFHADVWVYLLPLRDALSLVVVNLSLWSALVSATSSWKPSEQKGDTKKGSICYEKKMPLERIMTSSASSQFRPACAMSDGDQFHPFPSLSRSTRRSSLVSMAKFSADLCVGSAASADVVNWK